MYVCVYVCVCVCVYVCGWVYVCVCGVCVCVCGWVYTCMFLYNSINLLLMNIVVFLELTTTNVKQLTFDIGYLVVQCYY